MLSSSLYNRLLLDYELAAGHSIGIGGIFNMSRSNRGSYAQASVTDPAEANFDYTAREEANRPQQQKGLNLHYLAKLDSLNSSLSVDADYGSMAYHNGSQFQNRYFGEGGSARAD